MSEPSDSNTGNDSDQDFDPTAEMMVNDFDDEHTLDEEEAELNEEGNQDEIAALTEEQDMPIEELLARFYPNATAAAEDQSNDPSTSQTGQPSTSAGGPSGRTTATAARAAPTTTTTTTTSSSLLSDYESSESDDEFSANEDEWRRVIQVGADYQAVIPEGLAKYEEGEAEDSCHVYEGGATSGPSTTTSTSTSTRNATRIQAENRDHLLWKPTPALDDRTLDAYVRDYEAMFDEELASAVNSNPSGSGTLPNGEHNRDDDQALFLLFKCGYDVAQALEAHRLAGPNGLPADATPIRKMMEPWTEEECRAFETGLRHHGKDFFTIKRERIGSRTVGEVVTFYYFWKKTERHDQFVTKYRIEKKKYALHPGTTDYMDRFLDEQENLGTQTMVSGAAAAVASTSNMNMNASNSALRPLNIQQQQAAILSHSLLQQAPNAASNFHLNPNNNRNPSHHGGGHHHHQQQHGHSSYQANSRRDHHHHHHHHQDSSSTTPTAHLLINTGGGGVRTINVSGSGETQTILINDSGDFNGGGGGSGGGGNTSSGGSGSRQSDRQHQQHQSTSSASASCSSTSPHATIVVGKNPVVIDGDWVSSGGGGQATTSSTSPTSLSTPSVSIYKIPSGSSPSPSSGSNRLN